MLVKFGVDCHIHDFNEMFTLENICITEKDIRVIHDLFLMFNDAYIGSNERIVREKLKRLCNVENLRRFEDKIKCTRGNYTVNGIVDAVRKSGFRDIGVDLCAINGLLSLPLKTDYSVGVCIRAWCLLTNLTKYLNKDTKVSIVSSVENLGIFYRGRRYRIKIDWHSLKSMSVKVGNNIGNFNVECSAEGIEEAKGNLEVLLNLVEENSKVAIILSPDIMSHWLALTYGISVVVSNQCWRWRPIYA